jgi:serine protease Do
MLNNNEPNTIKDSIHAGNRYAEHGESAVLGSQDVRKSAKAQQRNVMRRTIAAMLVCGAVSFGAAYGGAVLGNTAQDNATDTASVVTDTASSSVIYQSVIRTSATGEEITGALSVGEIAELASVSVVEITTETVVNGMRMGQFVSEGAGSGVVVTTDGYIVTNNHVIDGASKITVRLSDGESYEATLIGKDAQTDLAVIKIDAANLAPAVLGSSSTLHVGDAAVAIGNPLGELGGTVTDGIISALDREITIDGESMTLLQTNAAINPGNSGGGLFNSAGELIGIVNAKSSGTDVEGLGFAIPIDTAKAVITELTQNGYVSGRPSLGITLVDMSDTMTAMMNRVSQLGVYVAETEDGSEFEPGDMIVSIDGTDVSSMAEIKEAVSSHNVGDRITASVIRGNSQQNVTVTIQEMKQ